MRKLERSTGDRVLLGVCGGVARYVGLPPDLVRVAWLLSVPLGGVGLVSYAAATLLVPESAEPDEPRVADRSARIGGLLLVMLALLVHLAGSGFDSVLPWGWVRTWGTLLPMLIFGAGVLLLWPAARETLGLSADRKVRRSAGDRVIAGACGGIAREAGVDSTVVRLVFVVLGATTWIALLLYLMLVLILPEEDAAAVQHGPVDQASAEGDR